MDLKEHIVGEVEGYPVIYIEEKDTIFCKNTAVKYSLLKRLYDSPFSREKIEEKSLTITKEEHFGVREVSLILNVKESTLKGWLNGSRTNKSVYQYKIN